MRKFSKIIHISYDVYPLTLDVIFKKGSQAMWALGRSTIPHTYFFDRLFRSPFGTKKTCSVHSPPPHSHRITPKWLKIFKKKALEISPFLLKSLPSSVHCLQKKSFKIDGRVFRLKVSCPQKKLYRFSRKD